MTKAEQDAFWNTQVSKLKRAGLLSQPLRAHEGYRQKLHSWKGGDITLNAGCDNMYSWVHVDITMKGKFRFSWYERLESKQQELTSRIEKDLAALGGVPPYEWTWERRESGGESWIILRFDGFDLSDKRSCEEAQIWVRNAVAAFMEHFKHILETM